MKIKKHDHDWVLVGAGWQYTYWCRICGVIKHWQKNKQTDYIRPTIHKKG